MRLSSKFGVVYKFTVKNTFKCNNTSPPLADIVRFGPLRIAVNITVLNTSIREKFSLL